MADLNRLEIMGRLTKDPELKYSGKGLAYCTLNIATTRTYKTQNGEKKEDVFFASVTIFDQRAEFCASRLKKGTLVFVDGHLQNDNKEVDGKKTYSVRIQAENIQLLAGGVNPGKTAGKGSDDIPF